MKSTRLTSTASLFSNASGHAEIRDTINGSTFQVIAGPRKGQGNVEFKKSIIEKANAALAK